MYMKIPFIELNNTYTKVDNKIKIINFIKGEGNIENIEDYIKFNMGVIKNNPHLKIQDVIDIIEECNYRINQIKGVDKLPDVVKNTKKETSNLNNIEVIFTPYYINDKNKEGFRHDVTYVKIKDEVYEVRDVDRILVFLGNKEMLKEFSEYEIHKFIKEHSDLIKTNNIDRINGKITTEQIEEEIKQESDVKIRDSLIAHKNDVVKEREKLDEYINKNNPGAIVKYGVNSNEERIYTVGDELIKFDGPNRDLRKLNELDVETLRRDFEVKQGYDKNNVVNDFKSVKDFTDEIIENTVDKIVDKQYNEEELTSEEIEILTTFIELYIDNPENISYMYETEINKWYDNNYNRANTLPTKELQELYEKLRVYRLGKVPTYEYNGFIFTFTILETSLVLGLIASLIWLFK